MGAIKYVLGCHSIVAGYKENTLTKRCDRCRLIILDFENGIQLGDLEQIVNVLAEVHQLESAAMIADRGVAAHQFPDAGAINVPNVAQIKQNVLVIRVGQAADNIADHIGSLAEPKLADDIYDDHIINRSRAGLDRHGCQPLSSCDLFPLLTRRDRPGKRPIVQRR
jgi:hypothetical protein